MRPARLVVVVAGLFCAAALAQSPQRFGAYEVHYNALATSTLSADVAKQYSITRSARGGMLNIAVQKPGADGSSVAVTATISGEATNLTGQKSPIAFREIAGADVSYVGLFEVKGPDTYTFTLSIKPADAAAFTLRFNQNFVGD
jgi:hypothetical protein